MPTHRYVSVCNIISQWDTGINCKLNKRVNWWKLYGFGYTPRNINWWSTDDDEWSILVNCEPTFNPTSDVQIFRFVKLWRIQRVWVNKTPNMPAGYILLRKNENISYRDCTKLTARNAERYYDTWLNTARWHFKRYHPSMNALHCLENLCRL